MTPMATTTAERLETSTAFHGNKVKLVAWRWGVPMDDVPGLAAANKGFTFEPAKVKVPALSVIGEDEHHNPETWRQQAVCMEELAIPTRSWLVTPLNEGAANHVLMENRRLMAQVVFDWLDDVFKK